jgi:hypothetical protein
MCLGIRANVGGQQVVVCRQKSLSLRRRDNLNNLQELVPQVGSVVAVQIRLNALQDLPNMGVAHHRWGKAHASKLMVKHRLHHRVVQEGVRHSTISMQMAVNELNVLSRGLRSQPVAKPTTRQGMRSLSIHLKLLSEGSLALSIKLIKAGLIGGVLSQRIFSVNTKGIRLALRSCLDGICKA